MKCFNVARLLGLLVLVISIAGISLYAQQDPAAPQNPSATQPQDQQTPPPDQQSQPMSQGEAGSPAAQQPQSFSGTIVKSEGQVVLRDEATSTEYKLDNEDAARQYMGKNVRVTGILDPSTNTIHITNIEMQSKS